MWIDDDVWENMETKRKHVKHQEKVNEISAASNEEDGLEENLILSRLIENKRYIGNRA